MTNEDMKYRQGRSKKQVETNEKLGLYSGGILVVILLACLFYSVFN